MPPAVDPVAHRADLERQLALLLPVLDHLRGEAAPAWVTPDQWRGPASQAAERMREELRRRLAEAADAVDDVLRVLGLQLAALA